MAKISREIELFNDASFEVSAGLGAIGLGFAFDSFARMLQERIPYFMGSTISIIIILLGSAYYLIGVVNYWEYKALIRKNNLRELKRK